MQIGVVRGWVLTRLSGVGLRLCIRITLAAVTAKSQFSGFSNDVFLSLMEQSSKGFLGNKCLSSMW